MPAPRQFYVYIMGNRSGTIYTGMTNNLMRRVSEHRQGLVPGFTKRYGITKLVYHETADNAVAAITREKAIKGWKRNRKVSLIESVNPRWVDLAADWYGD